MSFSSWGLECKCRKSRDICNNTQVWLWSTKWSRAKANRLLPREGTGHSKHLLPTTQKGNLHMDITRWSILKSDWLYSLKSNKENSIQSAKTRLGADCGSDHKLLIAKFRLKLKKVGKTTRPFKYDLYQIPCNYTVGVTNRFKNRRTMQKKKILMTQITMMVWSLTHSQTSWVSSQVGLRKYHCEQN